MRDAIPPEKRLAVCLWHLATGEDLRSLSWRFDIGKSTACVIINEVCQAIVCNLLPSYVKWPTGQRLEESVSSFFTKWNFPQCVGAIDGTHIEIVAPDENSADYYNRKGRYSIIMQAVVDHAHRFIDVNIKWPGKVHDARVLVNSSLYERAQTGKLFPPDSSKEIEGVQVPLLIIGDAAYPLLPWLMKPFPDGDLTPEQATFNAILRRARMIVEVAFGRLKGRFRCLLKRIDTTLKYLPAKIASCVVLHNLCEMREEVFNEEWLIPEGFDDNSSLASESRASDLEKDAVRNALVIALSSA
ncbi:hypothetical protein ABFA07_018335 [Porites harrisoni]